MDFEIACEAERLILIEQAQIRRLEQAREEISLYAAEAVRTRQRIEALQRGVDVDRDKTIDFVEYCY